MGDRNHEDSARKSKATRAGLKRRAERGQPAVALSLGFKVEDRDRKGSPRIIDPEKAPLVQRMFATAQQGSLPGEISRQLNREGATTVRGKPWNTRAVRALLRNRDYLGENGYPRLIEPEQFEAVQRRLDESKRPWGVAPGTPAADDFVLAGFVTCGLCRAPMRSRRCSTTGRRTYRCSNAMEGRNLCAESRACPGRRGRGHADPEPALVHRRPRRLPGRAAGRAPAGAAGPRGGRGAAA